VRRIQRAVEGVRGTVAGVRRTVAVGSALLVILASAAGAQSTSARPDEIPVLHHTHLNTTDAEAAINWYLALWTHVLEAEDLPQPTYIVGQNGGQSLGRGEIAGYPAFIADLPILFNEVATAPEGGWDFDRNRAHPQSAFWHIGAFANTTDRFEALEAEGFTVARLFTGPTDEGRVYRSGQTPYNGVLSSEQLADFEPAEPRAGGFGYLVGPEGALVEITGSPRSTPSFSHVHLFHEQPRCAANWYARVLGFTLPNTRDAAGESVPREAYEPCEGERAEPGWPSLEPAGTVRGPSANVRHAESGISIYPRQCFGDRCDINQPLVPSRGQVLDHIAFSVTDFDGWLRHLAAAGVTIQQGPEPFGAGRSVIIAGPDGLSIELVEVR